MRRGRPVIGYVLVLAALAACSKDGDAGETSDAGPLLDASPDVGDQAPPAFTTAEWTALLSLSPVTLPPPPADVTNAKADDPAAAALGQMLFYTPLFAGPLLDGENDGKDGSLGTQGETGKVACASCHVGSTDFTDTRSPSHQISFASSWGRRRAPSLLDVGQTKLVMWDGRRDALFNQVFGPMESPVEMNSSRLYVAEQVFASFQAPYEQVFGPMPPLGDTTRFPKIRAADDGCHPVGAVPGENNSLTCDGTWVGYPGDHGPFDSMAAADQEAVTRVVANVGKAIGAFERLLTCGPSRFDQFMHGSSSALSAKEQWGAQLFVSAGRCISCHTGPFLSDQKFHAVGLPPASVAGGFIDVNDQGASVGLAAILADPLNSKGIYSDGYDGRLPASVPSSATGAFRTPALRCVSRRPSFLHTAQATSLDAVVLFFNSGGEGFPVPGTNELSALGLSEEQEADLVAFLKALDGPGADPKYQQAP